MRQNMVLYNLLQVTVSSLATMGDASHSVMSAITMTTVETILTKLKSIVVKSGMASVCCEIWRNIILLTLMLSVLKTALYINYGALYINYGAIIIYT